MENTGYSIDLFNVDDAQNMNFQLHNHEEYEVYLFLQGDAMYVVEDKLYNLEPLDIIIIRKQEMHRMYHNSSKSYKRFVLMISPDFFKLHNCLEYENAFLNATGNIGNKINADAVRSSGLYDAYLRLYKYSEGFKIKSSPVIDSIIVEMLYILNNISTFASGEIPNSQINSVISYINNNYTENITLSSLSDRFYISKYYLCRTFKKLTGLTVQNYIKQKRLTLVKELKKEGKTLMQAAMLAGFNDYSSFYRAYTSKYETSPKKDFS